MTSLSEQQQGELLRKGDRAVLAEVLEVHQRRLFNTALRMVGHREDAAEITQQAMLNIVQHARDFRGDASVGTWMMRILMNQALSHLRRRRVRQATSLEGSADGDQAEAVRSMRAHLADTRELSPAQRVETDDMLKYLQTAIGELDGPFRAVLVLRDIDERSYDEIAAILDLPVGTIKSRLFRARLALRQQMQALVDGGEGEVRDG